MQSSKATNILLAIIAVCLIVIAMKPAGILPSVSAQIRSERDEATARIRDITAASDQMIKQQVSAIQSVASAIERLADSGESIAKAIDGVGRSLIEMSGRAAEGAAATAVTRPPGTP